MQKRPAPVFKYLLPALIIILLCSAHKHKHTSTHNARWKHMAKKHTVAAVSKIDFGKGSIMATGKQLAWSEWNISFRAGSLPELQPYAPVPEYEGKALVIKGLQAYSNRNGIAEAEIIFDGRVQRNLWSIDIFKPRPNGGGAPLFHTSFYIDGPVEIELAP